MEDYVPLIQFVVGLFLFSKPTDSSDKNPWELSMAVA